MKNVLDQVIEFHTAFGLPARPAPAADIPADEWRLRHRIMAEENDEYLEACEQQDLTGIADALGDQLYVLCGTIIAHGMQHKIEEVFAEIHRSNMSKLDENGNPVYREDGKILKSQRFFRPDIQRILSENE